MRQRGADAMKASSALGQRSGRIKEGILFGRKSGDITFGLVEKIQQTPFKNRRYNGTLAKELSAFSMTASTATQQRIVDFQTRFFEIVNLGRITRFAREFAFDAGAIRAFDISKKTKLRNRHIKEFTNLGLKQQDINYLKQFNNIDDAMDDSFGKLIIERAGRSAADRDALIPTVGNRRLFSQSNNPWMRFAGSFLSWAQAKSAQTNSLIGRVEEGDAKLAVLMLTTLPIYASVRQLQLSLHPDEEVRKLGEVNPFEEPEKFLAEGAMFSGQQYPWYIDKVISSVKYNQDNVIETIYPAYSLVDDIFKAFYDFKTGDLLAVELVETAVPFGKEITRRPSVGQAIGLEESIAEQAEAEADSKGKRPSFAKGGIVEGEDNVPFTKEDPADRINPYTGEPYQEQMSRLGFSSGGAILNYIAQARGYEDPTFLKQYADDVKWQEVRGAGPTTVQNNNGPARGSYQVEGSEGSNRNETILQRAKNFYEKYPDAPKSKEIEYALEQSGKDLDFSSLSEDTQDALFYIDAERGKLPLDELASGKLDHKTAWMNYWNQGTDKEVMEQKWDKAQEEKIIFLNAQNN